MSNNYNDIIGIFQGDLVIKTAIELGIQDIRNNPWIIDDMFRSLVENQYLKDKYGWKEITRAREFILNNNIYFYMAHRIDKQEFPCVTITVGESREDKSLATLGDQSVIVETLSPEDINQTISFVIPPFIPTSYDKENQIIEIPTEIENYKYITQGMIVVDIATGNGAIIEKKDGINGVKIHADLSFGDKIAIVPEYQIYRARRERATSQESYNIGCHVHGDPSTLLFLHAIVKYGLYRYRESLLESSNFQLGTLTSTDMIHNNNFGVENVYSRWITLSGQVEESWVKTPHRVIESVGLGDSETEESDNILSEGIKIIGISEE